MIVTPKSPSARANASAVAASTPFAARGNVTRKRSAIVQSQRARRRFKLGVHTFKRSAQTLRHEGQRVNRGRDDRRRHGERQSNPERAIEKTSDR
jgi:hypothetical protein